jgi:hypothetical protein
MHSPLEAKKAELSAQNYFLVNLKEDPSEQHNIADQHPDVIQRLEGIHQKWIEEVFAQ